VTGTNAGLRPAIDPQACNALVRTAAGLLVPRAVLSGLAPGGVVGASRSVDIDVTDTGGVNCPDTWQIGARLSPVSGEAVLGTVANLLPSPGAWVNSALTVTLPEPGRYYLSWDVRAQICGTTRYCTNAWTEAAIFDNATGAAEAGARTVCQHQFSIPNDGTSMQTCQSGSAPITHITRVTTAQGSRTLRLRGVFRNATTCANSSFQSATPRGLPELRHLAQDHRLGAAVNDEITAAPQQPGPRYFTKDGEGVQVVYNLRDASPYAELGYQEVDEAAYLASVPDVLASPLPTSPEGD
jgi:hypothetical protein